MELIKLSIPVAFIRERASLTWRDILYGIDHELLDPGAPAEHAAENVSVRNDPSSLLVELADIERGGSTRDLVRQLANLEPEQPDDDIRNKWLYVVLAWIFEHRANYTDPLQTVEEVYADFGYPRRIAGFVRYMPMVGPDLGSRESNERRLLERWQRYLDECSDEFAASRRDS